MLKIYLTLKKESYIFKNEITLNTVTFSKMKFMTKAFRDLATYFHLRLCFYII